MRLEAPGPLLVAHANIEKVGDHDGRIRLTDRCAAGAVVKADHPERLGFAVGGRLHPQIADQVPRRAQAAHGLHAAPPAPGIKLLDAFAPAELILTHGEDAVGRVKGMGVRAAVAVDLVPIAHFETVERVPEDEIGGEGGHVGPVRARRTYGRAPRDVENTGNGGGLRLRPLRRPRWARGRRRAGSSIPYGSGRLRPSAPPPRCRRTRRASAPRRRRTAWLRPLSGTAHTPRR